MTVSLPMTWGTLRVAMVVARSLATEHQRRYRVIRENGADVHGTYYFRVLPADECSCNLWTETVHHSCPVHPVEEPCS